MELISLPCNQNGLPVNNDHQQQIPRLSFANDAQDTLSHNEDIG